MNVVDRLRKLVLYVQLHWLYWLLAPRDNKYYNIHVFSFFLLHYSLRPLIVDTIDLITYVNA